jgi:hypothetical protein
MARQHSWTPVVGDELMRVDTCVKCGLLRLVGMNGTHYFTRIDEQHTACPSPYRDTETEKAP